MTKNLNIAAYLVIGMMTISTVLAPPATLARTINPIQPQAKIAVDAVSQYQQGLIAASAGDMTIALDRFDRAIASGLSRVRDRLSQPIRVGPSRGSRR